MIIVTFNSNSNYNNNKIVLINSKLMRNYNQNRKNMKLINLMVIKL